MKKLLTLSAALLLSTTVQAYDKELAADYQQLFAPVQGATAGKALHLMKPEGLLKAVKEGKQVVTLDVRTKEEMALFSMNLPNSLNIPANEVFLPENLAKLPTDKKIVVVCKSGARAVAVGTALRHIGFDNVAIVKGGFHGIAKAVGPNVAG